MELLNNHTHLIIFAGYFTRDPNEVQELVQDTLIKCWEKAKDMPENEMEAYSARALRNIFIDKQRRKKRKFKKDVSELRDNLAQTESDGIKKFEKLWQNETIRKSLDFGYKNTRQPKTIDSLILFEYYGLSYLKIGELMNANVNQVGSWIRYAKNIFKKFPMEN